MLCDGSGDVPAPGRIQQTVSADASPEEGKSGSLQALLTSPAFCKSLCAAWLRQHGPKKGTLYLQAFLPVAGRASIP